MKLRSSLKRILQVGRTALQARTIQSSLVSAAGLYAGVAVELDLVQPTRLGL
jgi:hypothetical protein